jgi:hypothetical protein
MPNTNAKAPNWAEVKLKRANRRLYYLNDYGLGVPRLRIESTRGGERCLWRAITVIAKMEETRRYLEKCWHIK